MTTWEDRIQPSNIADRTAYDHDMYGVEVEVEYNYTKAQDIVKQVSQFWSCVPDGSLRSHGKVGDTACEFRYTKPLNSFTSALAVKQLCQVLNGTANEIYDSGRTSTHVHVNVMNIDKLKIMNLITLSVIFDELLVAQHHPFRRGNLFALRFVDAEWPIRNIIHSLKSGTNFRHFANANYRYASINLTSIARFGTIEYRAMDGELNAQRINQWVFALHNLKKKAVSYKNPREIIETYHRMGPTNFLREHIPSYYALNIETFQAVEMLTRGMLIAQDLAYASDWVSTVYEEKPRGPRNKVYAEMDAFIAQQQAAQQVHDLQLAAGLMPTPQAGLAPSPLTWGSPSMVGLNNVNAPNVDVIDFDDVTIGLSDEDPV